VERGFGLRIPLSPLTSTGYLYLAGVIVAGLAVGLIPAWKAYRNALADGLSVRI
jgi:putative ABC transport system permease protein